MSESAKTRRRVPKALALAAALLGLVEFGVARQDWVWAWVPHTDVGVVDALEAQVIAGADDPHVVLLGSSRIRDAVAPRVLESELALPEGSVLNLGLTGGTAFDARTMYERNRVKLSGASIAVVAVEPWQLAPRKGVAERERRFASLSERMSDFRGSARVELLVGWAWRTYDARDALRRFVETGWAGRPSGLPLSEDGRVQWRDAAQRERAATRSDANYAERHYAKWKLDEVRGGHLASLVNLLREDGVEVVVLEAPTRRKYQRVVRRKYPQQREAYRDAVERLAGADHVSWLPHEQLALNDTAFEDYGHVGEVGAKETTRLVAAVLRPRLQAGVKTESR